MVGKQIWCVRRGQYPKVVFLYYRTDDAEDWVVMRKGLHTIV